MSAAAYWEAHPGLANERHKHTLAPAKAEAVRKAEGEVERFLITQLNYQPPSNHKKLILGYLSTHSLPLTAESLTKVFHDCSGGCVGYPILPTHRSILSRRIHPTMNIAVRSRTESKKPAGKSFQKIEGKDREPLHTGSCPVVCWLANHVDVNLVDFIGL